ncbi:MAG: Gfo/Idh/MocA family oxidoreductase [Verrucomicrobiales bacterium]
MENSTPPNASAPESGAKQSLTRRTFLRSSAITGAGFSVLSSRSASAQSNGSSDLKVALIGNGAQGEALMESAKFLIPEGIRITAVCDIWDFKREAMARRINAYWKEMPESYKDFDEFIANGIDKVDCCVIAVPDFLHAPFSRACLEAGKPTYCEKMMSNTLEAAADMVRAQRETGKLLQIGHQRRSNPRYLHLRNNLVHGNKIFGRVTHSYGQWNRAADSSTLSLEKKAADKLPPGLLEKYGYGSPQEFFYWRLFKKYGGGVISDLGAHQIDLFNWFYKATPKSVIASGGTNYHKDYEFEDNVMCIYEYETDTGAADGEKEIARAYYQVLTTTSSQGFYEKYMGVNGTAVMSEVPGNGNEAYREAAAPDWRAEKLVEQGLLKNLSSEIHNKFWEKPKPWHRAPAWMDSEGVVDARVSKGLDPFSLPVVLDVRPHTPHLKNFFDTVRANGKQEDLNCTVEDAYRTCVTVLKIRESLASGAKYTFTPEDFTVV